jgi:hypothetical protein
MARAMGRTDTSYTRQVHVLEHGIIKILEGVFAFGALICLLAVIPSTAYRLFLVLFEPDEEEHKPESKPAVR